MSVIDDLKDRLATTQKLVSGIADNLRSIALGAARGEPEASRAASKLASDRRKAEDDATLLTLAIEAAEVEEAAERDRVAAEREAQRIAEVEAVSAEVIASAGVVDDAARMLSGALARRRDALRRLRGLGVPPSHLNRLDRSETVARSLRHHGVTDFLDLPGAAGVPSNSIRPLAAIDRNLLSGTP